MSIRLKDTIYETSNNSIYSTDSDKIDGYHFTDLCSNRPHHSVSSTDTSCWYKLITIDVIATGWGDLFYEFEITGRSSGSWGRIRIWAITHNLNKLFGVEPKVTYDGTLGGKFKAYRYTVNNVDKFELWMSLGTWETWNFYVRTYEKETSYMALTWNKEKFTAAPTGFTKEITIGKQDIAGSASKLATARTISLTGSVTGSGTFDGSANLSIATTTNHTHNYAGSSSSGGAATSANKLSTARTISLTGAVTGSGSFDGSTNLSISTTVNHTHSYLPLSGGTVTGTLIIKRSPSVIQFLNASGTTFGYLGFSGDSTPCMYKSDGSTVYTLLTSNNYTSWAATKNHTHNYAGSSSAGGAAIRLDSKQILPFDGTNSTYRKFATLNLTSRYTGYRSNIKVFLNQCTGNQGNSCDVYVRMYQQNAMGGVPAYRLETNCDDRYFKIYGVLNYSSSISTIDLYVYGSGSSYYSISATLISGDDVISIGSSNISKLPSGTLIEPTKMGSVYSAGKLTTARTISLTGAVTGSGTFDGSGNLSIATTVNHTHNYAGSSSAGGAATSALKLTTARTISLTGSVTGSGTFDGSGNLSIATTTNHNHNSSYVTALGTSGNYLTWTKNGTTNNITIPYATYAGNADKLDNYHRKGLYSSIPAWINANEYTKTVTVNGDANTYYPVVISTPTDKEFPGYVSVWKNLGTATASYSGNHSNGTSSMWLIYEVRNWYWDGNGGYLKCWYRSMPYATLCAKTEQASSGVGALVVYLRGGGTQYKVSSTYGASATVYLSTTNIGDSTYPVNVAPTTSVGNGGMISSTYLGYGGISGSSGSVRDAGNSTEITFKYSSGGFSSSPSYLAAWNNYQITYVSPSNVTVGNAASATKLDSNAGSSTNPVYFSGGKPVACTYSLNKTVPSDAKFTDTNTWRGITDSYSGTATDTSLSQKGGNALYNALVNGYASSAGNADTLDGYHASSFALSHSHNYHPLGGSWKPSSLSSYTRHWGWAYSSAEAGMASNGTEMQIYTDGKFWQREGAYYCLDNGNTYVSGGTGVINGSTITNVSYSSSTGYVANGNVSNLNTPSTWSSDGSRLVYDNYSGSASNKPVSHDNANCLITLFKTKHGTSGQYTSQLAFPDNGRIYHRVSQAGTWTGWGTIAFTSDIPSSLPANGGNADTVDGKHASDFAAASHTHNYAASSHNHDSVYSKLGHTHSYAASSHTHNYAGSSSAGGAATSANKLNTNAGSVTKPVYFSGGVPVQVTGCMIQYWAIYEVYFSPSGTSGSTITKKAGNHNFCSSISSREALGQIIVRTSYPSGFDESTTMIFGVGDHAESNHIDSVYITVNKQYGSGTQMRLILADDDRQNWGYAHLYFLCIS